MADAARFPGLMFPFAIAGAAAGWLSVGVVQHPVLLATPWHPRAVGAGVAAVLGAVTGALVTRWCAGRADGRDSPTPDPSARSPGDRWTRHAAAVLTAGALAGAAVSTLFVATDALSGALFGLVCALPFLPVCAVVLAASRRARRARLGSLVAASDRRAVWSVLSTSLAVATLEAAPDWAAPHASALNGPRPALGLLAASTLCLLVCLLLDGLAIRRANRAGAPGFMPTDERPAALDDAAPRLDLGLGVDVRSRVAPAAAAYRGRARTLGIVEGDPARALSALRSARRRGALGLAVVGAVALGHLAADSATAHALYEARRCSLGRGDACALAAGFSERAGPLGSSDPRALAALHARGCDFGDGPSCLSLAGMYRGGAGLAPDFLLVAHYEYRAAQRRVCPPDTVLVVAAENVCVLPTDRRAAFAAPLR